MIGQRGKEKSDDKPSRVIIALLVLIFFIGIGLKYRESGVTPLKTAIFVVNGGTITAEIADTPEKKELGLGMRENLEARHGMYFPFSVARKWLFWMKDMRFPIDVIWMRDGVIVDVTMGATPPNGGFIERFSPSEPADAVLEINAGEIRELNVKKGDRVRMIR